jgi:hypothetical protein
VAEEDPKERVWDFVASSVRERFGRLITEKSPSLRAIIDAGSRYVKLETDVILFDLRALTLGFLLAGAPAASGMRSYAAARFREWIEGRIPPPAVAERLAAEATPAALVEAALGQRNPVDLSTSIKDLLMRAGAISLATINHSNFDGRHLFAAMIEKGAMADQVQQLFGLSVGEVEVEALIRSIIDEIVRSPEEGGTRESWEATLGLATGPSPPAPPEPSSDVSAPQSGPQIMRFSHDGARRGGDVLETSRDVEALAKLVCLKGSTPLAVAIFGGWGSGKTTFMEALDEKVAKISAEEAEWTKDGDASPFVTRIVQIRFNAWQFVDANLWASLTAEFFDQLRAGGWRRAGTARHAGLVEKVNSHVHSLTAEAAARRAAVIESNRQVLAAQEARDAAAKAVRDAPRKAMGEAALDSLGEIYEAQKGNLAALGLSSEGVDPVPGIDAVIEAVRGSRSLFWQTLTFLRMVVKYRAAAAIGGLLLLAGAVAGWVVWSGRIQGIDYAAALAALGGFAAFWRAVAPALRFVASVGRRGADLARAVEVAGTGAVRELMGKEVALRAATAEAEALAGSADRADRALARYVDPAGPSNPPRLLRYVLEDDPETKAFEKEIGLIGRARRLFQAVNDIVVQEDGEAPQRIVLYIDDLDRCTEEQVYNVLQAIHLLLAFESFAVIVGVDVKWIEGALAAEFAQERLPPLSEIDRRQHAVHYLEKIFQVAFWLDPLNTSGDDGGSFARFVEELTKPEAVAPPVPDPSPGPADPPAAAGQDDVAAEAEAGPPASEAVVPGAAPTFAQSLVDLLRRLRAWLGGGAPMEDPAAHAEGAEGDASPPAPDAPSSAPRPAPGWRPIARPRCASRCATRATPAGAGATSTSSRAQKAVARRHGGARLDRARLAEGIWRRRAVARPRPRSSRRRWRAIGARNRR